MTCCKNGCGRSLYWYVLFRLPNGKTAFLAGTNPGVCFEHREWMEQTYREFYAGEINMDSAEIGFVPVSGKAEGAA